MKNLYPSMQSGAIYMLMKYPKKLEKLSKDECAFQIGTFKAQEFVFESNQDCQKWINEIIEHKG